MIEIYAILEYNINYILSTLSNIRSNNKYSLVYTIGSHISKGNCLLELVLLI